MTSPRDISKRVLSALALSLLAGCSAGAPSAGDRAVTLLYTADAQGYLEACACATGGELGGIARRAFLVDSLRSQDPGALLLEAGDFATGPGAYGEAVGLIAARSMRRMKYDAVLPGEVELNLGPGFWDKVGAMKLPFVHTNFGTPELGAPQAEPLILERQGHRVALLGLLGPDMYFLPATKGRLAVRPPLEAAGDALRKVAEERVDLVVALTHMRDADVGRLVERYPQIDVVVAGHTSQDLERPQRRGSTLYVTGGFLGQHLGVLRLSGAGLKTAQNASLRIETSLPEDPEIARWVSIAARK